MTKGVLTGLLWEESERDWPEDYEHENGHYLNRCCRCEKMFAGHKRRIVCKACYLEEETQ